MKTFLSILFTVFALTCARAQFSTNAPGSITLTGGYSTNTANTTTNVSGGYATNAPASSALIDTNVLVVVGNYGNLQNGNYYRGQPLAAIATGKGTVSNAIAFYKNGDLDSSVIFYSPIGAQFGAYINTTNATWLVRGASWQSYFLSQAAAATPFPIPTGIWPTSYGVTGGATVRYANTLVAADGAGFQPLATTNLALANGYDANSASGLQLVSTNVLLFAVSAGNALGVPTNYTWSGSAYTNSASYITNTASRWAFYGGVNLFYTNVAGSAVNLDWYPSEIANTTVRPSVSFTNGSTFLPGIIPAASIYTTATPGIITNGF